MTHNKALAIKAAKEVELLWLEGMPFNNAVRIIRPKYIKALQSLHKGRNHDNRSC